MQRLRLHLRPFAWLALVAMLALALVPTVSRAMAVGAGDICSASAVKGAPADGGAAHRLDHCALCVAGHCALAGPPAAPASPLQPEPAAFRPPLFDHAPAPLFAWAAAHPRGPPAAR